MSAMPKKFNQETDKRYSAKHPANNEKNHQRLLEFVTDRLEYANTSRSSFVDRLERIDKETSGYVQPSAEDRSREADIRAGRKVTPTQISLPLARQKMDDITTYMLGVFLPDGEYYEAMSDSKNQQIANAAVREMNKHAKEWAYVRQLNMCFDNMNKYNLGGVLVEWNQRMGNKITDNAGKPEVKREVMAEGNGITCIDLYNFLYDRAVHPVDLWCEGEFFALIEPKTRYQLKRMWENQEVFQTKFVFDTLKSNDTGTRYYKPKPQIRPQDGLNDTTETDFVEVLSGGRYKTLGKGTELQYFYGWLVPKEFGLSEDNELQVWLITVANSTAIIACQQLNNMHGRLPIAFASPLEDNMGTGQKSVAEMLMPLQRFGTFLINTHMQANRKAINGITAYDPSILDMSQIEDDVQAKVPVKPAGYGKDIRNAVQNFNDAPETAHTMQDLGQVIELMELMFPTQRAAQIADLQRATEYQAAEVVQASNRRNLKMAKVINDQMFMPMRTMMTYNLLQFMQTTTVTMPDGQEIQLNPADLRQVGLQYLLGEGLSSMDRMVLSNAVQQLTNSVLQSPEAMAQIDVVKLLNYGAKLRGEKLDMEQFRKPPQMPAPGSASAPPGPGASMPEGQIPGATA